MKLLRCLRCSVLALSLLPRAALADEPSLLTRTQQHVEADLLNPLAAHDDATSAFSRMRMPPRERRVRLLAATTANDAGGRAFLPFAIDGRPAHGEWHEGDVVGCVYPEKGDMFVKMGASYRPATFLLGVAADPVAGVCQSAPARRG